GTRTPGDCKDQAYYDKEMALKVAPVLEEVEVRTNLRSSS
ncbi:hypothetical protein CCACVL1_24034, partial [Corchorus capsularis]